MKLSEEQVLLLRQHVMKLPDSVPEDVLREIELIVSNIERSKELQKTELNRLFELLNMCGETTKKETHSWEEELSKLEGGSPKKGERTKNNRFVKRNLNMEIYQFYNYLRRLKALMIKTVVITKGVTR